MPGLSAHGQIVPVKCNQASSCVVFVCRKLCLRLDILQEARHPYPVEDFFRYVPYIQLHLPGKQLLPSSQLFAKIALVTVQPPCVHLQCFEKRQITLFHLQNPMRAVLVFVQTSTSGALISNAGCELCETHFDQMLNDRVFQASRKKGACLNRFVDLPIELPDGTILPRCPQQGCFQVWQIHRAHVFGVKAGVPESRPRVFSRLPMGGTVMPFGIVVNLCARRSICLLPDKVAGSLVQVLVRHISACIPISNFQDADNELGSTDTLDELYGFLVLMPSGAAGPRFLNGLPATVGADSCPSVLRISQPDFLLAARAVCLHTFAACAVVKEIGRHDVLPHPGGQTARQCPHSVHPLHDQLVTHHALLMRALFPKPVLEAVQCIQCRNTAVLFADETENHLFISAGAKRAAAQEPVRTIQPIQHGQEPRGFAILIPAQSDERPPGDENRPAGQPISLCALLPWVQIQDQRPGVAEVVDLGFDQMVDLFRNQQPMPGGQRERLGRHFSAGTFVQFHHATAFPPARSPKVI